MCSGYWETCNCEECLKAKGLYDDLNYYWDDEKRIKEIEEELEDMGYSV